jgi:hypothetical protein
MSETRMRPALASYRDTVTELMQAGQPFGAVEDAIDEIAELPEDAKAALWLLAFSMRGSEEQAHTARAHLVAVD